MYWWGWQKLLKRLYEQNGGIRLSNSNYVILHIYKTNYNFNFNAATMLTHIQNKILRQIFQASAISSLSSVNTRPGFFNLSPFLGKLVLNSENISNFKLFFSSQIYTSLMPIYIRCKFILRNNTFIFIFSSFPLPSRLRLYNTPTVSLKRSKTPPPNECPKYDIKQSDGEVPAMLELWGMRSNPLLPSLPGQLCPGVVAPDKGPIYGLNRTKPCFLHNADFGI